MAFVDFAALKNRVAIETVLPKLGLEMNQTGGQYRGPCPACQSGGKRALVVTPKKSAFYCFGGRIGGDVIALVAHIQQCSMKDAARYLSDMMGEGSDEDRTKNSTDQNTVPEERIKEATRSLQPLSYLQADHAAVEALGVTADTCVAFSAGYAPKGIMRGRLAIPIHDRSGTLVAYCGYAVSGESPSLIFPNGFKPWEHIFNAQRIEEDGEGELILVRDPLEVLLAWQNGIANTVSFLTETVQAEQLEMLATLMDTTKCDHLEIA